MALIKRIFRCSAYNCAVFWWSELVPKKPRAPRVGFAGYDDDGAILLSFERGADCSDLVGGIQNRGLQHMNRPRGNAFVDQDASAVKLLSSFERNSHRFQRFLGLRRMGKPNFGRVALAI